MKQVPLAEVPSLRMTSRFDPYVTKIKQRSNKINHNYTGRLIMYSGIRKIYYRKTAGHVFTKPVQIERTTQKNFSPGNCFSS